MTLCRASSLCAFRAHPWSSVPQADKYDGDQLEQVRNSGSIVRDAKAWRSLGSKRFSFEPVGPLICPALASGLPFGTHSRQAGQWKGIGLRIPRITITGLRRFAIAANVSNAQIADCRRRLGERVITVPLLPFPADRGKRPLRQEGAFRNTGSSRLDARVRAQTRPTPATSCPPGTPGTASSLSTTRLACNPESLLEPGARCLPQTAEGKLLRHFSKHGLVVHTQADQPPISTKPLADGAGHTFSTATFKAANRNDRSSSNG
jgi:hypothetical protein